MNRPPLAVGWTVSADVIRSLPAALRASQQAFAETGGLHAAGLFDRPHALEIVIGANFGSEDVDDDIAGVAADPVQHTAAGAVASYARGE